MSGRLRNRVREARLRLGLSQQELAARAGVTRQAIGAIEAGAFAPSTAVALRLARALGCRVEDLFWLDDDAPEIEAEVVQLRPRQVGPGPLRCALARVGGRWVAHPLQGEEAFATELVPADGVARPGPSRSRWRVRLLDRPEDLARTVVIAGCSPELSLWARAAEATHPGLRVRRLVTNSVTALQLLRQGAVHAAGVHLVDPETGEENASFARRILGGQPAVLIHFGVWEEGLVVAPGNPLGLRGVADLARPGVEIVNREPGAGSRLLLEQYLAQEGVPPAAVAGFDREVSGHLEVARAVAGGQAHAGVSTASVAAAFGLGFVPLRAVRYDLVVRKEYLDEPAVQALLGTLGDPWVRAQLTALGGYDTSRTGEVVGELAG
ncbi:MAG TPA: substrate-binding domain-containing protein [Thermaerobacter sp.]